MASDAEFLIRETARQLRANGLPNSAALLVRKIPEVEDMSEARYMLRQVIRGTGPGMTPLGDRVWNLLTLSLRAQIGR